MSADPRPEVLRRVLETDRAEIHTAKPGRIVAYDKNTQTATVRLGVRQVIPSGDDDTPDTTEEYPDLHSVPVLFPGSGTFYVSWGLRAGDTGLVVFCDTDIGQWRGGAGEGAEDPGVTARHSLAGAVFLPGLFVRDDANPDASGTTNTRWGLRGGTRIEIRSGVIEAGGTKALAEAADVKAHLAAISSALATMATNAGIAPPTYVYATVLAANPIDTSILKGD